MKNRLMIGAAACAIALAAVGGVTKANASSTANVHLTSCIFGSGAATVPAGSTVSVNASWIEQTHGRVQSFLNSQTTTANVNGVQVANASSLWLAPFYDGSNSDYPWRTTWTYVAGTLTNPGDQLTVTIQINLQHHIPAGKDPDTGKMLFDGPGDVFPPAASCTITAV
jgi:hypothetical protein